MKNQPPVKGHSEDYFGGYRDYWWNNDFLALMAKRLDFTSRKCVLEVGCGAGHWTRAYSQFLSSGCTITCVDSDPKWFNRKDAVVRQGEAAALSFPDASFDLVTCQTVLIHLPDPRAAIREMLRVLQPGGLLLCVEPDNLVSFFGASSTNEKKSLDEFAADFRFELARQRGRIALGLGNLSLGGRLPGMFESAGVTGIHVHLSDKVVPLFPPYRTPEQAAFLEDIKSWFSLGTDFTLEETRKCYLAGGGSEAEFDAQWPRELANRENFLKAVDARTYDCGCASTMYLVSGSKI